MFFLFHVPIVVTCLLERVVIYFMELFGPRYMKLFFRIKIWFLYDSWEVFDLISFFGNVYKRDSGTGWAKMPSSGFWEISKNSFFTEHPGRLLLEQEKMIHNFYGFLSSYRIKFKDDEKLAIFITQIPPKLKWSRIAHCIRIPNG